MKKKKQLDRETQDAQGDFQNDMQQTIDQVAQKVGLLMTDYAEKHGYTLVLDAGQGRAPSVSLFRALDRHHKGNHRSLQPEVGHSRAVRKPARRAPTPPASH